MRYGNRYYSGANRYVYYRNGAPQYYYSESPFTLQTSKSERIKKIFSNIISAIMGAIVVLYGFFALPHKVKTDYNTEIIINDAAQLLSETEEAEMNDAFLAFLNKTGVTPAFFTIRDASLQRKSSDLSNYAYRLYTNTFDDEKHWLVVYCIGDNKGEWVWEGMIGDDCGSMITTDLENEFTKLLQKNFAGDSKNISASVINAFETIGRKSGRIDPKKILTYAFAFIFGGVFLFTAVKKIFTTAKTKPEDDPRINSVQCAEAQKEPETAKCQYCDGEFVVGLHTTCPHCGAPIETWE